MGCLIMGCLWDRVEFMVKTIEEIPSWYEFDDTHIGMLSASSMLILSFTRSLNRKCRPRQLLRNFFCSRMFDPEPSP
jgi:hypothetical protein